MRYFVQFSYRGTDYHGSQRQPNGVTVQEVLEDAFYTILRVPVALTFAGRTDAGVHAKCMYAHFDVMERIDDPHRLVGRLNNLLPNAIAVQGVRRVKDDAHARFDALARTYEYCTVTCKDPFAYKLATRIEDGLDVQLMNEAAQYMIGQHDFASFCRVHTDVKTTLCHVMYAQWENGVFRIKADRFLRNMVRAVVGTLLDVGKRKVSIEAFQQIILAKNRCAAGQSAPAEGLYLVQIDYPENIFIDTI